MKFIVDRCAGRRLAEWLSNNGHDVIDTRDIEPDPGDRALLELAASQGRVLITIDKDFGELIHRGELAHSGLVRLPDVLMPERIAMLDEVISCETKRWKRGK